MPVEYVAPTRDMRFVIEELAHFDRVSTLPGCEEFSRDLIEARWTRGQSEPAPQ